MSADAVRRAAVPTRSRADNSRGNKTVVKGKGQAESEATGQGKNDSFRSAFFVLILLSGCSVVVERPRC